MNDFFLYLEYKSCKYRITAMFNDETDIIANKVVRAKTGLFRISIKMCLYI
jgi:hypothetical protein